MPLRLRALLQTTLCLLLLAGSAAGGACRDGEAIEETPPTGLLGAAERVPTTNVEPPPATARPQTEEPARLTLGTTRWRMRGLERVAVSRDGRFVLVTPGYGVAALLDGGTGERLQTFGVDDSGAALSADGAVVACAGERWPEPRTLRVFDAATARERRTVTLAGDATALALNGDGSRLAVGEAGGAVELFDTASGEELLSGAGRAARAHYKDVNAVAFVGARLASADEDGKVVLWSLETGTAERTVFDGERGVVALAATDDGERLACLDRDNIVRIFALTGEPGDGAPQPRLEWKTGAVTLAAGLAIAPDGRRVATGDNDGRLILWDGETGQQVAQLIRHAHSVGTPAFSGDGQWLYGGGYAGAIRKWNTTDGAEVPLGPRGHAEAVRSLAVTPDGGTLIAAGYDSDVPIWDLKSGDEVGRLVGHTDTVRVVALHPDGRQVATGGYDGRVRVWDIARRETTRRAFAHERGVGALAWSPDGRHLASGGLDGALVIQAATLEGPVRTLRHGDDAMLAVAWSPDGTLLAGGDSMGIVGIWDTASGLRVAELREGYASTTRWLAFSPDGRTLAAAIDDKLLLSDVNLGATTAVVKLPGMSGAVGDWSEDGKTIVVGDSDGTVALVGVDPAPNVPARVVAAVARKDERVRLVQFLPGDRQLVVSRDDTTLQVWDVERDVRQSAAHHADEPVPDIAIAAPDDTTGTRVPTAPACAPARDRLGDPLPACAVQRLGTRRLRGHHDLTAAAFSEDGRFLAAGGDQCEFVHVWDTTTGAEVLRAYASEIGVDRLLFADGHLAACDSLRSRAVVWDIATGRQLDARRQPGRELALRNDGTLTPWRADAAEPLRRLPPRPAERERYGGERPVKLPDGRSIYAANDSVYLARPGQEFHEMTDLGARWKLGFDVQRASLQARKLVVLEGEEKVALWPYRDGPQRRPRVLDVGPFSGAFVAPDGERVAVVRDMAVELWSARRRRPTLRLDGHDHWVDTLRLDGQRATTLSQGWVQTWDIVSGELVGRRPATQDEREPTSFTDRDEGLQRAIADSGLDIDGPPIKAITRSPDGKLYATSDENGGVQLRAARGGRVTPLFGHDNVADVQVFSPDGRWLATGDLLGEVRVWSVREGALAARLTGHRANITALAFSDDSRRLLSASWDSTVLVWDLEQAFAAGE